MYCKISNVGANSAGSDQTAPIGSTCTLSAIHCPPTLVKGDYSNGFVRPSVHLSIDTILSRHLLLQFSRDFDETFQFPWPEDVHILSRSCSTDFYQSYGPLTIFQQ